MYLDKEWDFCSTRDGNIKLFDRYLITHFNKTLNKASLGKGDSVITFDFVFSIEFK